MLDSVVVFSCADRYVNDACVAVTVAVMLFIVPSQKPNYLCFRKSTGMKAYTVCALLLQIYTNAFARLY